MSSWQNKTKQPQNKHTKKTQADSPASKILFYCIMTTKKKNRMFSLPLVFWTWQGSVFRRIFFSSGGTQWIPHSLTICVFQFWEISLNYFHSWHLQRVLFVLSVLLSAMDHPVFSFPASHHLVIDSIFWMVSSALCYNFAEWFLQLYVTISCGTFHPSFQMCSFQELSVFSEGSKPLCFPVLVA